MPIRVQCSRCKTALRVNDHLAGKRVKCPKCQEPVAIPQAAAGSPMPVAKPPAPVRAPVLQSTPADLEAMAAESLGLGGDTASDGNGDGTAPANGSATAAASGPAAAGAGKPIVFQCEFCDEQVTVEFELAGKKTPCPECRRIIKVPVPQVEKPKDWRTVETKGPSAAKDNLAPAKPDDAWGTENKKNVSQKSLQEAGVAPRAAERTIPLADRIAWWVTRSFVAALVGVMIWGLVRARSTKTEEGLAKNADKEIASRGLEQKWPKVAVAALHQALGTHALRQGDRDEARDRFRRARQLVLPIDSKDAKTAKDAKAATDAKDRIDADAYLIHLVSAQADLGGDQADVDFQKRFGWNQEVFREIQLTLTKLRSPETRVLALRELSFELARRKKLDIAANLAAAASTDKGFESVRSQRVALVVLDPSLATPADKDLLKPERVKTSTEPGVRAGHAEGLARKGAAGEAIAELRVGGVVDAPVRFEALVGVASVLALDPQVQGKSAEMKEALDTATKILDKELKDRAIAPWTHLQMVRLVARSDGPDTAKALLSRFRDKAFERRAQFEILVATLERCNTTEEAKTLLADADPEFVTLAWLEYTRFRAQAQKSTPIPENEDLRFLVRITEPSFRPGPAP